VTARRLKELDNEEYVRRVREQLFSKVARVVLDIRDNLDVWEDNRAQVLADMMAELTKGQLRKKLEAFIDKVIDLARLVVLERATYTVEMPPQLSEGGFRKLEEDPFMTNVNTLVGTEGGESDAERSGIVAFVSSPMLVKRGAGAGRDLHQHLVLVKACVELIPPSDISSEDDEIL